MYSNTEYKLDKHLNCSKKGESIMNIEEYKESEESKAFRAMEAAKPNDIVCIWWSLFAFHILTHDTKVRIMEARKETVKSPIKRWFMSDNLSRSAWKAEQKIIFCYGIIPISLVAFAMFIAGTFVTYQLGVVVGLFGIFLLYLATVYGNYKYIIWRKENILRDEQDVN